MIDELLLLLLKKGSHREAVRLTTGEIASELGISQQSASRKLIALVKEGKVKRAGRNVSVSALGVEEGKRMLAELKGALEGSGSIVLRGKVIPGVGEGKYYLSQKGYARQIREKLGFEPFPGTMNVRVAADEIEKRLQLKARKAIVIEGFEAGGRSFGRIGCYRCEVGAGAKKLEAAVVFPERSHHGLDVIEVIAAVDMRKKLGVAEGSEVKIECGL